MKKRPSETAYFIKMPQPRDKEKPKNTCLLFF